MKRRFISKLRTQTLALFGLTLLLCALGAYGVSQYLYLFRPDLRYIKPNATWIKAPGEHHAGYFRKTFHLPFKPESGWVLISGHQSFEISVNGDTAGKFVLYRPTRPYHNGLSEAGQRITPRNTLLNLNYPREYQWVGHRNARVPIYIDISTYLKQGKNVIALTAESRKAPASILMEGEVLFQTGARRVLKTDTSWKAEPFIKSGGGLRWYENEYPDVHWHDATKAIPPEPNLISFFDPAIYQKPFEAHLLHSPVANGRRDVAFSTDLHFDKPVKQAWVRILSTHAYDLFFNNLRINPTARAADDLGAGQWIIGAQKTVSARDAVNLLDPDEVGNLFVGHRFMNTRYGDPNQIGFEPQTEDSKLGRSRADSPPERFKQAQASLQPGQYRPSQRTPHALTSARNQEVFDCFMVTNLLKPGKNQLEVKLMTQESVMTRNWTARFALDLHIQFEDGSTRVFESGPGWNTRVIRPDGTLESAGHANVLAPAKRHGVKLPKRNYRGPVYNQKQKLKHWSFVLLLFLLFFFSPLCIAFFMHPLWLKTALLGRLGSLKAMRRLQNQLAAWSLSLLPVITVLAGGVLLQLSFVERSEAIYFYAGDAWGPILLVAVLILAWSLIQLFFSFIGYESSPQWIQTLPQTSFWKFLIAWVLLACFFLRAFELDYQTVDDDEYASIQAALAIAETGKPQYSENVWYTRSPLYHYMAGAAIKVFGYHLWTIRLLSVIFGVATGWLMYLMASRLLLAPWTGLASLILYTLHPFLIFSSHIGRFYQQQQFFSLLTFYYFCLGFVQQDSYKYRMLTLVAFICAILSQELSAVIGIQMLFLYLLFAGPRPARDETRMIIGALLVIWATFVDVAIFQTQTLTRTEGVSPNVEATIALNFSSPLNYFSVFWSYSRLHLSLSLILFVCLPFTYRDKNRNVLALYMILFSGIVFTNLFVTAQSLRYQYWIIPLWILMGVYGLRNLFEELYRWLGIQQWMETAYLNIRNLCGLSLFTVVLMSWSPWRIPGSYHTKMLGDASGAFQYIRTHMREGDKVAATEPHPHGALLETGRSDFDIAFPLLWDFTYLDPQGVLRDRNGNAEVISRVDELKEIVAQNDRIWIAINREKFRSRSKNIRWEYPGARAELFLRLNCNVQYQNYLWTVFLWDKSRGRYHNFRWDEPSSQ